MRDKSRDLWGNRREYATGGQARFRNPAVTEPTRREDAALQSDHPALIEGRSQFPSRVFDASERDHVLIDGINNAKIGRQITAGPWAGCRQFNLSLEERATCPRSCTQWDTCFGGGMPMAVRFRYTPSLMRKLDDELHYLTEKHRAGVSVRLHVLGDFPDLDYLEHWCDWSDQFPNLHIWGYTAHGPETEIGGFIAKANQHRPERWQIRFSVSEDTPHGPYQVTTTWTKPTRYAFDPATSSMVCPQEIGKVGHCVTCGICWKPELSHVRVVFLGHGGRGHSAAPQPTPKPTAHTIYAPVAKHDPSLDDLVKQAIAAGKITKIATKENPNGRN